MLVQNNSLNVGEIVVVKLAGEEIIGRVASAATSGSSLRLTKVLRILLQMVQTEQGPAGQVTFAPFIVGADLDATIDIDRSKLLVAPVKPSKQIGDTYAQQTSSIVQAPAPGLVGL